MPAQSNLSTYIAEIYPDLIGIQDKSRGFKLLSNKISEYFDKGEFLIWKVLPGANTLELVLHISKDKTQAPPHQLEYGQIPWTIRQLQQSSCVNIENLEVLSEKFHQQDKKTFEKHKVKAVLLVPVPVNRTLGAVLEIRNTDFSWDDLSITALRKAAEVMGKFLNNSSDNNSFGQTISVYQSLFRSLDEGVLILDKTESIIAANPAFFALTSSNQEPSSVIGKKLAEMQSDISEVDLTEIQKNISFIRMGMKPQVKEIHTKIDDQDLTLEVHIHALIENQDYLGDIVIFRDISYRRGMEVSVQESESRLRRVIESVKEGITLSDEKGEFEIFNPEMEVLTGYTKDEANQADNFIELIHPEEEVNTAKSQLANFEVGETRNQEMPLISKNKEKKIVDISSTVIMSEGQRKFLSAFHDQTEIRKAEAALQKANESLEEKVKEQTQEIRQQLVEMKDLALFPSEDPYPVLRIKPDGELLYANGASSELLKTWETEVGKEVPDGWQDLVKEVYETNNRRIFEVEILEQVISFVLVPVKSSGYVNMYGRDVSKEKEIEEMKNQFISMVSHQIRTPLTSVRWYSEMLMKGKEENALNQKQTELTETIHETAVNLSDLVTDLLSISRMESGKLDYNPENTDYNNLVNQIVDEIKVQSQKGNVNLKVELADITTFSFDPKLIREVITNLLSNAIKYTPENGTVTLRTEKQGSHLLTQVIDTGIGIPEAAQKDIFQRFYRAQNAVDSQIEGTGLGLSVVKMIVEKAGGKIWFESVENQGTTFSFTLPLTNMI